LTFLATSLSVYLAWLVRNELTAGETTGRVARWHPPDWAAVWDGLGALGRALVTSGELGSITLPVGDAGRLLQLAIVATLIVVVVGGDWGEPPRIVRAGIVYALLYAGFLVVTVSAFDAATPLDERLFVPVVPAFVVAVVWLVRDRPVVATVLTCLFAVAVLQQARTVHIYGIHYSGRIWEVARVDESELPRGDLHSNWPAAVAYFTGRSPDRLPEPYEPQTLDGNPDFAREISRLVQEVKSGETALVLLDERRFPKNRAAVSRTTAMLMAECWPATPVVKVCARGRPGS
jgi:hypothetical protein